MVCHFSFVSFTLDFDIFVPIALTLVFSLLLFWGMIFLFLLLWTLVFCFGVWYFHYISPCFGLWYFHFYHFGLWYFCSTLLLLLWALIFFVSFTLGLNIFFFFLLWTLIIWSYFFYILFGLQFFLDTLFSFHFFSFVFVFIFIFGFFFVDKCNSCH